MEKIKILDRSFRLYLNSEEIHNIVKATARKLNARYKDFSGDNVPLFIGVLNGVYMFAADLMKEIEFDCEVSFIKLSSYQGVSSTGKITELIGLNESIEGRDIIVLDEIVDTGITIETLYETLRKYHPKSVRIATLIYKYNNCKKDIKIDFAGIRMPENHFIVGYGLDYSERGRQLKDIYIEDKE